MNHKAILASLLTIGVAATMLGVGTMAYFSDVEESTGNTFTAGTLNLELNDDDPNVWADGAQATWTSPPNWAPGQEVTTTLKLMNAGSVEAGWILIDPTNPMGSADFLDNIIVTEFTMSDNEGWSITHLENIMATWGIWGTEPPLTLDEFIDGIWCFITDPTDVLLKPNHGNEVYVTMKLQFNPEAGNELQGASCSFDLRVAIIQTEGSPTVYYDMSSSGYGHA